MPLLPALGTFQYNGFAFSEKCRTDTHARFLYDRANRTVIATTWTITAYQIVQVNTGVDAAVLNARQLLSKAGQQLIYVNNGFGGLNINTAQQRDVMWGPRPTVLHCRRIGSSNAFELMWTCEITIPECNNANYQFELMAFNYKIRFDVDQHGLTIRQITGYYEIPMTRVNGGTALPDHAENYWNQVFQSFLLPTGFDRIINSREFSEDKRTCEFAIVDREIPGGGYPPNCTSFSGVHQTACQAQNNTRYFSQLSASYIVAQGVSKAAAMDAFLLLLQDRLGSTIGINNAPSSPQSVQFVSLTASEGLGDNRVVSFEAVWIYFSSLATCMTDCGMFRSIPGTDWQTWIASPGISPGTQGAKGQRGSANLITSAADDSIIDLCVNPTASLVSDGGPFYSQLVSGGPNPLAYGIDPNYSWLWYHCEVETDQKNFVSTLKGLGTTTPPNEATGTNSQFTVLANALVGLGTMAASLGILAASNDPGTLGQLAASAAAGAANGSTSRPNDVIQNRTTPTYKIKLIGTALRGGYPIPYPSLTQYQGQTCTQRRAITSQSIVANWSGVPIYYAEWEIEYVVPNIPNAPGIPVPVNPALGFQ